ncbi:hypothetical protein PV377_02890 [Streptomyces ipomoeae]|uniref:hypothetical protein n=1 Tax=Streptomyces ipomoeae TaxID=103232 RepID=UPI0029B09D7B|nr:hypothetical protein [Streptomyces ipomoeae]MDX2837958.1 hypothetical protein [Streptomyces ipomoeae]
MTSPRPLPAATDLTHGQYRGWNCVWCDVRLTTGAVSQGRAEGWSGAHDLSAEVWACPKCAFTPPQQQTGNT